MGKCNFTNVLRVSTSTEGVQGNDNSFGSSLSGDATKAAFWSFASNLVPCDTNDVMDVFVTDLSTGQVSRASTTADGEQANAMSYLPSLSEDGGTIAFSSYAS